MSLSFFVSEVLYINEFFFFIQIDTFSKTLQFYKKINLKNNKETTEIKKQRNFESIGIPFQRVL